MELAPCTPAIPLNFVCFNYKVSFQNNVNRFLLFGIENNIEFSIILPVKLYFAL